MAPPLEFARRSTRSRKSKGSTPSGRLLGDKLQELAMRSPEHVAAIETLTDFILRQLDEHDHHTKEA